MRWHFHFLLALCGLVNATVGSAQDSKPEKVVLSAKEAQRRAVQFFSEKVAVHGGYVYQVSEDLRYREGEGDAEKLAVWVQPPGTPAVGMAYVHAYEQTREEYLLSAARATAQCLVRGQLHSGGWQRSIEFEPERRRTQAYRVDGEPKPKAKNWSSFDDDQTQSVIRFLSKLDRALQFKDQEIHETNLRALDAVLANQFPNGAWAQGFETLGPEDRYPVKPGEFPQDWSRQHPKQDYWTFYTLNDNALVRIIDTLWLAHDIYGDDRYKRAALRGADFLVLAQMPDPQPAWAQQYDFGMHPTWARKFEPPSISGRESQDAVECLMMTYLRTGEDRYKPPIERALRYLSTCVTSEGKIPRFLELKTNRPLFFTKEYQLTYSDSDLPTHYSFLGPNDVPRLSRQWEKLRSLPADALASFREKQELSRSRERPSEEVIRKMIDHMRADGAWIESGKLRYIKASDHNGRVISSSTFIQNLESLSRFLAP